MSEATMSHNIEQQTEDEALLLEPRDPRPRRTDSREIVRIALESLLANTMRSLLTMLGIIIGVASVVTLLALGTGASDAITGEFEDIGTNVLTILPGSPENAGPGAGGDPAQTLTMADAEAIAALKLPLDAVAPSFQSQATLVAPAADASASIVGVTPDFAIANSLQVSSGTFINSGQVESAAGVVVLGANLAEDLFGNGQAVGQTVRIDNQVVRVIGVLVAEGGGAFGSVDERAYVPITLAQQRLFGARTPDGNGYRVSSIALVAEDPDDFAAIEGRVASLLREQHRLAADGSEDDFNFFNQSEILSSLETVTALVTYFLAAVAGISLLVGGIGIMNIMLVTVTERTREIGLRKAVGARAGDILLQFVVEAVALSLSGGLIGVFLGVSLALIVSWTGLIIANIGFYAIALSLGFALLVGLFFGIYPARRAAALEPIAALRHE